VSRWPSSTRARCRSGSSSVQHNAWAPGHKALGSSMCGDKRSLLTPSSVVRALRTKAHGFRGNADQSDNRRPRSPVRRPASVDHTDARWPDLVRWQFVGATSCELATTQSRTSRLNGKWRVSHSAVAHRAKTSSGSAVGTKQHSLSLGVETDRFWSVSARCALPLRPLSGAGSACHAIVKNCAGSCRRPSRSKLECHICRRHGRRIPPAA
jgi:hypothetical protein